MEANLSVFLFLPRINGLMEDFYRHNSSLIGRKNQAKFENDCISRNRHRIKITQSKLMILVSLSSAEYALSNDVNNMTFLARNVLKIRRSAFFWDTRYNNIDGI